MSWRPKQGQMIYVLMPTGMICLDYFDRKKVLESSAILESIKFGTCFKTMEEAEVALIESKKFYKRLRKKLEERCKR